MGGNAWGGGGGWGGVVGEGMFHEGAGGPWGMEREIIGLYGSETVDLRGLRRKNMMGAVIPALMHRIPSELRS